MAIMVATPRQFAPGTNQGIDLAREYEMTMTMCGKQPYKVAHLVHHPVTSFYAKLRFAVHLS